MATRSGGWSVMGLDARDLPGLGCLACAHRQSPNATSGPTGSHQWPNGGSETDAASSSDGQRLPDGPACSVQPQESCFHRLKNSVPALSGPALSCGSEWAVRRGDASRQPVAGRGWAGRGWAGGGDSGDGACPRRGPGAVRRHVRREVWGARYQYTRESAGRICAHLRLARCILGNKYAECCMASAAVWRVPWRGWRRAVTRRPRA